MPLNSPPLLCASHGKLPETMIQTLYARAKETKKQNAKIKDEIAVELVEKLDYDFSIAGIIELVYIVLQSVVKPGITGFFKIDLHIKCYIYLS